jgi:hypothetical protein
VDSPPEPATPAPGAAGRDTPTAATSRPGPPAIYYAGWVLLALGGLIALVSIVVYLRFLPDLQGHRRQ